MLSLDKTRQVVLGEYIGRLREIMFRQGCEARRKYLSAWPLGGLLCSGGT